MATINGTNGSDNLSGTSGNDTLNGSGGNDTLNSSAGTDFYDGGSGFDTLNLSTAGALIINFATGTVSGGITGSFTGIERVQASIANDSIVGGAGNQNISARGGNDTLGGGTGNDTLWGGVGSDVFVFHEVGSANTDQIRDWDAVADQIALD